MTADDRLDTLAYIHARYREIQPRLAFDPRNPAAWKAKARPRLAELIALPEARVPLAVQYGQALQRTGHTRVPLTFATRPNMAAFAYLLIPDRIKTPAATIVCLPGHGRGADDLVGIAEDGTNRDHDDGYQHDFAVQCARNGYVALALEMAGFGHRRDPNSRKSGPSASSCQTASGAALMLGESMVGWRTWDAMRAIDFLETRPEVDPGRIAVMGISGGGTVALYAAALDERIKAALLSCSYCTFRDSIYSIPHCIDNFVPGILREFEVADITGLIAPRFLIAESGRDDPIFPEAGVEAALKGTRAAYVAQGAANHVSHAFFPAGHVFHGAAAFATLREVL